MQDKYVGDVGDFGKCGLLNEIAKQANGEVRLGINWYYTNIVEIGKGETDGKYIEYLNEDAKNGAKFKVCFPWLYDKLKTLVSRNERSIAELEAQRVLPESMIFYSDVIPDSGATPADRGREREKWFEKSILTLERADVVFVDPDNGIHLDPEMKKRTQAVKFVLPEEVEAYFRLGKSVVVYNHRDRSPKHKYDQKILINEKYVKVPSDVQTLKFKRFSVRHYIFVIQERHRDLMRRTIDVLTSPPRDFLFEEYFTE